AGKRRPGACGHGSRGRFVHRSRVPHGSRVRKTGGEAERRRRRNRTNHRIAAALRAARRRSSIASEFMRGPMEIPPPKHHSEAFLRIVEDAKTHIKEITIDQYREMLQSGTAGQLVDVREDSEY